MVASDLDRIRRLRDRWFLQDSSFCSDFDRALDQIDFTAAYVNAAIADSDAGRRSRAPKVIKDNTWGMIEVDWQSVRLLDSPILQRLRSIRQLGFSYLTYPTAEHSRFVHSLGMYAVVSRFLDAMNRQPAESEDENGIRLFSVQPKLRTDLLHAAILHDAGHLPFSHVTESALTGDQQHFYCGSLPIEDFVFSAAETLSKKLNFAETLSLALVLSPRFSDYYQRFVLTTPDPDAVVRIAALIAGLKPEQSLRGAANLISNSSVDADKVDYINRDALACGIPVGLDVARLFLRSSFYYVGQEHLKRLKVPQPTGEEVIFVVNASGVDTIDELAHARAALYQRVYLHQTTRNAERILSKALDALPELPQDPLRNALNIFALDDASLLSALSHHDSPEVSRLAFRLKNRQLPKRACVFGRSFAHPWMPITEALPGLNQPDLVKHTLGMVVERLRSDVLKRDKLRRLEADIANEAALLAQTIRKIPGTTVPADTRPSLVTVLPMTELQGLSKEAIVLENRELIHSSQRSISDEQNEAADIYKALGYVLTEPEWKELVCIAARKVLATSIAEPPRPADVKRTNHGQLEIQQIKVAGRLTLDLHSVIRRAGLPAARVLAAQQAAAEAGYFDNVPWLVPVDVSRTEGIASKLQKFEGEAGWTVTPKTCAAFISQFPANLREEMISLLESHFRLIDRDLIRTQLATRICQVARGGRARVCSLSPNSGNQVRTLLEQESMHAIADHGVVIDRTLDAALDKMGDDDLLVLCDDNISSGSQAACQLRTWLGVPREQWPQDHIGERNIFEAELTPGRASKLRKVRLKIVVCVGNERADEALRPVAADLSLKGFQGIEIADNSVGKAPSTTPELDRFLRRVGSELIAQRRHGQLLDELDSGKRIKCEGDALGYGNASKVLATYLNVPTATITCLWHPGMFNGHPWMPLLIRRGYLVDLVVA